MPQQPVASIDLLPMCRVYAPTRSNQRRYLFGRVVSTSKSKTTPDLVTVLTDRGQILQVESENVVLRSDRKTWAA